MSSKAAVVVPALKRHTSTIILVHGLGDSGAGWEFLAQQWRAQNKFPETKFIFPNAPVIPITVNMGARMPGWYDITEFSSAANRTDDEAGILRTRGVLHALVAAEEQAGIPAERIVLGGFSQGGSVSLVAGASAPRRLGGIFALSSYLLLQARFRDLVPADAPNLHTPIFMGHGEADPLVRFEWGRATAEQLKAWGYTVDFRGYPGLPHSAAPQEIDDLEEYLRARIPDLGDKGSL